MGPDFVRMHAPALALKPYQGGKQGFVTQQAGLEPEPMFDSVTGMPLNYIQQAGQAREFYVPQGSTAVLRGRLPVEGGLQPEGPQDLMREGRRFGRRGIVPIPPATVRGPQLSVGGAASVRRIPPDASRIIGNPPGMGRGPTLSMGGESVVERLPPNPPNPPNPIAGPPAPLDTEMFPTNEVRDNMMATRRMQNDFGTGQDINQTIGDFLARLNISLPEVNNRVRSPTSRASTARPAGEPRRFDESGLTREPELGFTFDLDTGSFRNTSDFTSTREESIRRARERRSVDVRTRIPTTRPPRLRDPQGE